jgi:hypothetical protein
MSPGANVRCRVRAVWYQHRDATDRYCRVLADLHEPQGALRNLRDAPRRIARRKKLYVRRCRSLADSLALPVTER